MVSAIDRTKRALVSLLKTLAGIYGVALNVTRDSAKIPHRRSESSLNSKIASSFVSIRPGRNETNFNSFHTDTRASPLSEAEPAPHHPP